MLSRNLNGSLSNKANSISALIANFCERIRLLDEVIDGGIHMTLPPDTRNSLIARLVDIGDHEAWREFAELYDPFIYRQARRLGLQHADARELVQEVLISVSKAIRKFEIDPARGRFRTWLYAVG